MNLARLFRVRVLGLAVALSLPVLGAGCSAGVSTDTSSDDVVSLPHTEAKNQAIGNCWLYATGSWLEALHSSATGEAIDLSESYWSYWHWYLQIVWSADERADNAFADLKEVETGGSFAFAAHILRTFGAMREGDFVPEEAASITSRRQASALTAINRSLREGALKDRTARADLALVRREMDAAWQLSPEVVERLDAGFGQGLDRIPDMSSVERHRVLSASALMVTALDPETHAKLTVPLMEILPTLDGSPMPRYAWQEAAYPETPKERRAFLERAQRALHDGVPPLLSFTVDFNAMRGSTFADIPSTPGSQGGHMVPMSDYEIENVPGFGTLKAGTDATPEQLEASLSPEANIVFIRVKNSWGPTGASGISTSGHYDLYMKYLDGPIKNCLQPDGSTDRTKCHDATPFGSLALPAGY